MASRAKNRKGRVLVMAGSSFEFFAAALVAAAPRRCPCERTGDSSGRGRYCADSLVRLQCGQAIPDQVEIGAQRFRALFGRTDAGDQENVARRKLRAAVAKTFAHEAANAVACDRVFRNAPRHRHAEPRFTAFGRAELRLKMRRADTLGFAAQAGKIRRLAQVGAAGKPRGRHASGFGAQGMRRLRPLARRALSTRRPPRVFIRARKPCVRACLSLPGWNVRFMAKPFGNGNGEQRSGKIVDCRWFCQGNRAWRSALRQVDCGMPRMKIDERFAAP